MVPFLFLGMSSFYTMYLVGGMERLHFCLVEINPSSPVMWGLHVGDRILPSPLFHPLLPPNAVRPLPRRLSSFPCAACARFPCAARASARTAWTPTCSAPARPARLRPSVPSKLWSSSSPVPGASARVPSLPPSILRPSPSYTHGCSPPAPPELHARPRQRGAGVAGTTRRGRERGAWDGADVAFGRFRGASSSGI